jgi:hypothetical protein
MNKHFWIRIFIATLILSIVDLIYSPTFSEGYTSENAFWDAISNLMVAVTMGYVVKYTHLSGIRLVLSLWLISFGIGSFNILIEAWIFNVTNLESTLLALLQGAVKFSVMSVALTYVYPHIQDVQMINKFEKRSITQWISRIGAGILIYLFFYIAAGMVLQASLPELTEFYKDKLPDFSVIIYTQLLRGLLFVLIAIFTQRICVGTTKSKQIILVGFIFSVLGGIAPLIPPNHFMPAIIRLGHGFEVGLSNFLYGYTIGVILYQAISVKEVKNEMPNRVIAKSRL